MHAVVDVEVSVESQMHEYIGMLFWRETTEHTVGLLVMSLQKVFMRI